MSIAQPRQQARKSALQILYLRSSSPLPACNIRIGESQRPAVYPQDGAAVPLSAVRSDFSQWRREAKVELFPTLRELGIGFVPWSPLGAGFLAGTTRLAEGDFRANNPRLRGESARHNAERFAPL